jgi:hypothetical protein
VVDGGVGDFWKGEGALYWKGRVQGVGPVWAWNKFRSTGDTRGIQSFSKKIKKVSIPPLVLGLETRVRKEKGEIRARQRVRFKSKTVNNLSNG